jgi:hypothetical protein
MGVARGTLIKRINQELKKREVSESTLGLSLE